MKLFDKLLDPSWIGVAIGLIGMILAYVFYRRSRIRSELSFQLRSIRVIGRSAAMPSEVEISFRGKKVSQVTKSVIVIWNSGSSTIVGDDIVTGDPLRIVLDNGGEFLQASVYKMTRSVNDMRMNSPSKQNKEVSFVFDYLDPKDGAAFEILHSGLNRLKVVGSIRGMPDGIVDRGEFVQEVSSFWKIAWDAMLPFSFCAVGLLMALTSLLGRKQHLLFRITFFIMSVFFIVAGSIGVHAAISRLFHRPPNALVGERLYDYSGPNLQDGSRNESD